MKTYKHFFVSILFTLLLIFNNMTNVYGLSIDKNKPEKNKYSILVDVSEFNLYLIDKNTNKAVKVYPIAGGKETTPSPYGTWTIISKCSNWGGGFGTRWMELNVPWGTYGIHGTNKPLTINNPDSLGCIRMFNCDIEELYDLVDCGTRVVIYGGPYGLSRNIFRVLEPGNKGSDVFEVQRRLRNEGYYLGRLNGIYTEELKKAVLKFKRDKKLEFTHYLDKEFYNSVGIMPFE